MTLLRQAAYIVLAICVTMMLHGAASAASIYRTPGQPDLARISLASRCADPNARNGDVFVANTLDHTVIGYRKLAATWSKFVTLGTPGVSGTGYPRMAFAVSWYSSVEGDPAVAYVLALPDAAFTMKLLENKLIDTQ